MNISGLSALLLELALQNTRVAPAAKAEGVAGVRDVVLAGKKTAAAIDTGATAAQSRLAEQKPAEEQPVQSPAFVPLPLRTELFRDVRFFTRTGEGGAGAAAGQKSGAELFIFLCTENLGNIWIALSCRKDVLSVKHFTDNRPANKILKENFPALREELIGIGFSEVSLTSQTRAELGSVVEGLLPKFEIHLLDRKI